MDPDRFLGRDEELARLGALLREGYRLLTVTGMGGLGKTRLAREFARRQSGVAVFAALDGCVGLEGLCDRVASALGESLRGAEARDPVRALGQRLARRGPLLLVLDDCEALLEEVGAVCVSWLDAAPALQLLCTSRESLRLRVEKRVRLGPLPVASSQGSAPALELFCERASSAMEGFTLDAQSAPLAQELVRRLEGIPLAIELAARGVELLGLEGLLARLPRQLDALGPAPRDTPPKHATLRAVLEGSWLLCSEAEQSALARCALFVAPFDAEAADHVLSGEGQALCLLEALLERSLLRVEEKGAGALRPRFTLFHVVREFALERLELLGARESAEERHARWFLRGPAEHGTAAALAFAAREREHLLGLCDAAARGGVQHAERAARALLLLDPLLAARGPAALHASLCERVLRALEATGTRTERYGAVLRARGSCALRAGEYTRATEDLEAGLALAVQAGDAALEALALTELGVLHQLTRGLLRARECYERAAAVATRAGAREAEARALANLASVAHDAQDFAAAREGYRRAVALFQGLGDARAEGLFHCNLGVLEQETARLEDAHRHYLEAVRLLDLAGDRRLLAIAHGNLGTLEHELGDVESARERHELAVSLLLTMGEPRSLALARARLAFALASLGAREAARGTLDAALLGAEGLEDAVARGAVGLLALCTRVSLAQERDAALGREVEQALESAEQGTEEQPALARLSDDARWALKMLRRESFEGGGPGASSGLLVLEVAPEVMEFRLGEGPWQKLQRFAAQRRILQALLAQHREGKGSGLSPDALIAAGWPGERILPHAAANRLYVELARLRKRGLKPLLQRTEAGYRLEPALEVRAPSEPR